MQYWCEEYIYGNGHGHRNGYGYGYGDGFGWDYGTGDEFFPALLVTGVKLEEVVLNAVLA